MPLEPAREVAGEPQRDQKTQSMPSKPGPGEQPQTPNRQQEREHPIVVAVAEARFLRTDWRVGSLQPIAVGVAEVVVGIAVAADIAVAAVGIEAAAGTFQQFPEWLRECLQSRTGSACWG